jgi:hypothetical protein
MSLSTFLPLIVQYGISARASGGCSPRRASAQDERFCGCQAWQGIPRSREAGAVLRPWLWPGWMRLRSRRQFWMLQRMGQSRPKRVRSSRTLRSLISSTCSEPPDWMSLGPRWASVTRRFLLCLVPPWRRRSTPRTRWLRSLRCPAEYCDSGTRQGFTARTR